MKKKIVLIHPRNDSLYVVYPLGCLYLSAYLIKEGYEPVIFDHNEDVDYETFLRIHMPNAVCVGISAITGSQVRYGLEISGYIKKEYAYVPVVWGGAHVTSLPNTSLLDPRVDIVVRGEGEQVFVELIRRLQENKGELETVLGISYRNKKDIVHNPDAPLLDLSDFPHLPWHLVNIEKKMQYGHPRCLSLQTGRGCPFSCTYCSHKRAVKQYRPFSAEFILNEITPLVKQYEISHVSFFEPHFISHPRHVEELCKGILAKGITLQWTAAARANTFIQFPEELIRLMKQSGCTTIGFGFESGSRKILERIDKRIVPSQIVKAIELCRRFDIVPEACFMVGFPFETWKDTLKTLAIIACIKEKMHKMVVHIQGYTPFPNTILYDECRQKYGLKEPQQMQWWGSYTNIKENTPWIHLWGKWCIRLLSATIFLSDLRYLKKRKDIKCAWLFHGLALCIYRGIGFFTKALLNRECAEQE